MLSQVIFSMVVMKGTNLFILAKTKHVTIKRGEHI